VLTRSLAHAGHYPAIDVLQSVSRLAPEITSTQVRADATELRTLMAAWHEKRDLIAIGAYEPGSDETTDRAVALKPEIDAFLRQDVADAVPAPDADDALRQLVGSSWIDYAAEPAVALEHAAPALAVAGAGAAAYAVAASPSAIPPLNLAG
jgi:flagellum-specific ATP synthase